MAEEEELELDVNQPKGSKMTTILLIVLIVLVLVMGGVGAWLFLGSDDASSDSSASSDSANKEETVLEPLKYLTMVPEFVVNFSPGSKVRYLQVDLLIATRDEAALETIRTYRPVLRNDILVILSSVSFDDLRERGGKEALQKKLLKTINKVVLSAGHVATVKEHEETKEDGHVVETEATIDHANEGEAVKGPIENVYFTSFIMQ